MALLEAKNIRKVYATRFGGEHLKTYHSNMEKALGA